MKTIKSETSLHKDREILRFTDTKLARNIGETMENMPQFSYLLGLGTDAKTVKGEKYGYLTAIQYLAPASVSGIVNLCVWASNGCELACLNTAGRASFDSNIGKARINRTIWYVRFKAEYWARLVKEIKSAIRKAARMGLTLCIRLNGTSDQLWERMKIKGTEYAGMTIFQAFPDVQFYDYTKAPYSVRPNIPENYHLTYSYSEDTTPEIMTENLANGRNVAVVFNSCLNNNKKRCFNSCHCPLPESYLGYKVISGDDSDIRFHDETGVIVGLHAKGQARTDTSGFVVHITVTN